MATYEVTTNNGKYQVETGTPNGSQSQDSGYTPIPTDSPEAQFQESPATTSQRGDIAFAKTPEGKLNIAQHLGLDATMREDGKLLMRNQATGEMTPITPDAKGFTNFLKDISGRTAEFIPNAFPTLGQIGGDVAGTALSGGNPIAGIAAGAAGAGAMEGARQGIANSLGAQESISPGAIEGEAGIAALGGTLGEFAIKPLLKGGAKAVGSLLGKLDAHAPEILKTIAEVPEKDTLHVLGELKSGRQLHEIISDQKADPSYLIGKVNHVLFGDPAAERTPANLINAYKRNVATSSSPSVVDSMYQNEIGMSPSTLDAMKKFSASEIMSKENTSQDAIRSFAQKTSELMDKTAENVQAKFGATRSAILAEKGNYNIPTSEHLGTALKSLSDRGLLNTDGAGNYFINDKYPGSRKALQLYSNFISRIATLEKGNGLSVGKSALYDLMDGQGPVSKAVKDKIASGNFSTQDFHRMFTDKEGILKSNINLTKIVNDIPTIKASKLNGVLQEFGTALDSFFSSKAVSSKESAPMADLIGSLKDELAKGLDDPRWKINNEMYRSFKQGSQVFGKMGSGSADAEIGAIKNIRDAYSTKDEQIKQVYADYISKLDQHIGKGNEILPRLNKLGAGQELQNLGLNETAVGFENRMTSIASNNPRSQEAENALKVYDNALNPRGKFLRDVKDAIASKALSKPATLYKMRYLAFTIGALMPGGLIGKGMALGAASQIAQPKNLIKMFAGNGASKIAGTSGMGQAQSFLLRQIVSGAARKRNG